MCALKAKQIYYSPSPVRTMAPRSAMYWPLRNVATLPPTRSCSIKKDCKDLNHRIQGLNRLLKLVNDKESCILTGCPSMMQSFFITRAQTPGQQQHCCITSWIAMLRVLLPTNQTCLATNQVSAGCEKLSRKVESSSTFCNRICTCCTFYKANLFCSKD